MISFQLTISVMCVFMTLSWAHIALEEPNLKVMTLTSSTNYLINNVTKNISLECAFNSKVKPWQTSMTQILRIRILKSDIKYQWNLMAEIGRGEDSVQVYNNVLGRGQIQGDMWTSYLNITWPIATATTFGTYQCDVLGYNTHLKYMSEESNSVKLTDCHLEREEAFNRFQHALDREIELIDKKVKLMNNSIFYDMQDNGNKVNNLYDTLVVLNESLGQKAQSVDVEENFNALYEQMLTLNRSFGHNLQSLDEKVSSLHEEISTLNQSLGSTLESLDEKFSSLYEEISTLKKRCPVSSVGWIQLAGDRFCVHQAIYKGTYNDAHAYCSSIGGKMLEIETRDHITLLESFGIIRELTWVGADDFQVQEQYRWKSGALVDTALFAPGEPHTIHNIERCLGLVNRGLADLECHRKERIACAVPAR